ncbi:hypothetical protein MLD38_018173 [Melastoma candidum]|uniref:Uncharacterized protein n=1 Tax=Melastoma candidum TaxID=119954 RepID=A0ACB9QSY8_9MYRT|nr:hypothetical protein MLD38_018173 [Melastoma candidum]
MGLKDLTETIRAMKGRAIEEAQRTESTTGIDIAQKMRIITTPRDLPTRSVKNQDEYFDGDRYPSSVDAVHHSRKRSSTDYESHSHKRSKRRPKERDKHHNRRSPDEDSHQRRTRDAERHGRYNR